MTIALAVCTRAGIVFRVNCHGQVEGQDIPVGPASDKAASVI